MHINGNIDMQRSIFFQHLSWMHHVDFHQSQDHVKLSSPCIISMSLVAPVKPSIMVVVVAMPTNMRRRICANMSAQSTVRKTNMPAFLLINLTRPGLICSVFFFTQISTYLIKKNLLLNCLFKGSSQSLLIFIIWSYGIWLEMYFFPLF